MNTLVIEQFRSIETVDPTTLTVFGDRVEVAGGGRKSPRSVPLRDLARIKVRTLLGVSTILLRTPGGTVAADLFQPAEARAAAALIAEVGSAPAEPEAASAA